MIYEEYEIAISQSSSYPVPQEFTQENLEDLQSLKLKSAQSLQPHMVRGGQRTFDPLTDEAEEEKLTLEDLYKRLEGLELQIAKTDTINGGIEGISILQQTVAILKKKMNEKIE